MKYLMTLLIISAIGIKSQAQTLQTVTNNGNVTTNSITVGTGYSDAKLNVNAIGNDVNGSNDLTFLLLNHRYNSTNNTGENRMVFGWGNHYAAAISAYKESSNTTGFKFYTEINHNNPVERMRISAAGNVSIGTSDAKGYKLAVAGSMIAESVKVKLATNWPDYVFTKDYKLPTLFETEKYIQKSGHLQGIPSSVEVKINGVDLGEMNKKLLEKVEELTLHLIEQNKRINKLERKLKTLNE